MDVSFLVSLLVFLCDCPFAAGFSPFADNDLFMINWAGPIALEKVDATKSHSVMVTTVNKEKYHCILPKTDDDDDKVDKKELLEESANKLLEKLFSQSMCSYRIESFWTYELCHGKHMRQYHENKELGKKQHIQEYYLGFHKGSDLSKSAQNEYSQQIKTRKVEGIELPYYQVNMTDGTHCDLTGHPRQVVILYVCQPEGRGEIYEMKEVSTCAYEIIVLTSVLCASSEFRPKNLPVGQIYCHSLDGSPRHPLNLKNFETENTHRWHFDEEKLLEEQTVFKTEVQNENTEVSPKTESVIVDGLSETTDKQSIREFINGDSCLTGDGGWWKHEFCFGKYARQYHDDSEGRKIIFLGHWNKEKHLNWLRYNPAKKPKPVGKRKFVSLLYTDGDFCDQSGKQRLVEVKLKCVENSNRSHSFALYLLEPNFCEYVMGVESPMFCSLLDKADENGIF